MNLLNAVKLAADPKAQDRGVLVGPQRPDLIRPRRHEVQYDERRHIQVADLGYLGYIAGGKNYFLRNPRHASHAPERIRCLEA